MSNETTPAIERGATAGPPAYTEAMVTVGVAHVWRHVATSVLAAALDVEEMARVMAGMVPGEDWPTNEALGGGLTGTRDDEFRNGMLDQARELRDAILGGAA